MLTFYGPNSRGPIDIGVARNTPAAINWIDALDPTETDVSFLKDFLGSRIPSREELSEIETSSRLYVEDGTLFLSLPAATRDESGFPRSCPIGFILNRDRLATLRFSRLSSFEHVARQTIASGGLAPGGLGALVTILELMIDQLADVLERVGADLDGMSRDIFTRGLAAGQERRPHQANKKLSEMLKAVGESGELVSKVSESLLGLNRMIPFVSAKAHDLMTPDFKMRLDTVNQDTKSLREFVDHLTNKTQFMLDTLLGLANIEQNNVFRVLTVVSVVGIPPTFFASMYGMNFKSMPEYDWTHGYAYGLTLIVLSALLPAIWFKVKGWW